MLDKHPFRYTRSVHAWSVQWKMMPGGRRRCAEQVTTQPHPSLRRPARLAHSRWCPRKWISSERPCPHAPDGGRRRDKEAGGRKTMTWRQNSQGGGSVALYGLICLFACVCVFVFVGPMHALAKVMGPTTGIISIHCLISSPRLVPNTSYFDGNFICAVQSEAVQTR